METTEKSGMAIPLTKEENGYRMKDLNKLSFADLKALELHCADKMNYHNRRFPKDKKLHKEIYDVQYSWWVQWFGLHTQVQYCIDMFISDISSGKL
jgi:hypothetical protein